MRNVTFLLEKLYWEIALFVKDEIVDDGPIWATEKKKTICPPKSFCPEKKHNFTNENIFRVCPPKNEFSIQKNYWTYPQKS